MRIPLARPSLRLPPPARLSLRRYTLPAASQTLTLLSPSPSHLLTALRSTLQRITHRASLPPAARPTPSPTATVGSRQYDHVLLFSLSKSLPPSHLAQAVSLLRGHSHTRTPAEGKHGAQTDRIVRIGVLSSAPSASLLPAHALGTAPLHSVSLSLLPGACAIPFRSEIAGRDPIAVGRWPDRKPVWKQAERRAQLLDPSTPTAPTAQVQQRDWRDVWGRENLSLTLPPELEGVEAKRVVSLLLFTDTSPQGLLEGVEARFPKASVVGLCAPKTPFETGRERTLFRSTPDGEDRIYENGAVGVALVAPEGGEEEGRNRMSVEMGVEGLQPFGPRREVTDASGNIISTLAHSNAAHHFLRDLEASPSSSTPLTPSETRTLASRVSKTDEFYIGLFSSATSAQPLLLAPIGSGHPTRGTLAIETQADLGPGTRGKQGSMRVFAQFFKPSLHQPEPWEVGQGQGTRFVFVCNTLPSPRSETEETGVLTLENTFLAGSEEGWVVRRAARLGGEEGGAAGLKRDGTSAVECRVPRARVVLQV
ncbi:hypothetical protein ACQY0O_001780 [Thecaphora frezii]